MTRTTLKDIERLEKRVEELETMLLEQMETGDTKPTTGGIMQNSASSVKDKVATNFPFFITHVIYKLALWALILYGCYSLIPLISNAFKGGSAIVTPATELLMTESQARLTFKAMDFIAKEINDQSIRDTATASEALYSELPLAVQEPVVEAVKKESDGTIQQYPAAMENTKRRIMIRR